MISYHTHFIFICIVYSIDIILLSLIVKCFLPYLKNKNEIYILAPSGAPTDVQVHSTGAQSMKVTWKVIYFIYFNLHFNTFKDLSPKYRVYVRYF